MTTPIDPVQPTPPPELTQPMLVQPVLPPRFSFRNNRGGLLWVIIGGLIIAFIFCCIGVLIGTSISGMNMHRGYYNDAPGNPGCNMYRKHCDNYRYDPSDPYQEPGDPVPVKPAKPSVSPSISVSPTHN